MTIEQKVDEICQRTARLETRMVSMASQMGIDLQNGQKLTTRWSATGVMVDVVGIDISFSRIRNALNQDCPDRHGTARVFHNGALIGTVIY